MKYMRTWQRNISGFCSNAAETNNAIHLNNIFLGADIFNFLPLPQAAFTAFFSFNYIGRF